MKREQQPKKKNYPKLTVGNFYSHFTQNWAAHVYIFEKKHCTKKTLSLTVLLLFHYEHIPNQIGQMQMHKSPLLFLRLNNSVRISFQTNVVWLTTTSYPSNRQL